MSFYGDVFLSLHRHTRLNFSCPRQAGKARRGKGLATRVQRERGFAQVPSPLSIHPYQAHSRQQKQVKLSPNPPDSLRPISPRRTRGPLPCREARGGGGVGGVGVSVAGPGAVSLQGTFPPVSHWPLQPVWGCRTLA